MLELFDKELLTNPNNKNSDKTIDNKTSRIKTYWKQGTEYRNKNSQMTKEKINLWNYLLNYKIYQNYSFFIKKLKLFIY